MTWADVINELHYALWKRRRAIEPDDAEPYTEEDIEQEPPAKTAMQILSQSIIAVEEGQDDAIVWERAAMAKEALERERQLLHIRKLMVNQEIREKPKQQPTGWFSWLW